MKKSVGKMRNGESVEISFDEYEEGILPEVQWIGDGDLPIASGWLGFPVYWNHYGKYLDGARSPHEFDLVTVDGYNASEELFSRHFTRAEIDEWLAE